MSANESSDPPVDPKPDTEVTAETEIEPCFVTVGYRRRCARVEQEQTRSPGGEKENEESPERIPETPTAIADDQEAAEEIESGAETPEAPLSQRQGHIFWLDIDPEDAFPKDECPPPPPTYPLHQAVFENDPKTVAKLLESREVLVAQKDMHGNTPLHLALAMGHKECAKILFLHHAPVKIKNKNGWTPMHEAISYGDRETITNVLRKLKQQSRQSIHGRKPHLIASLKAMRDFYLEMRWEFRSWIPFLSSMLPSDVCKIYKRKGNIRMDTTLIHFNEENWERGDMSFIFRSDDGPDDSLIILDNIARVYQKVRSHEAAFEVEQEVDIVMSSDIVNSKVSMSTINFRRAKTGFWIFREDKTEKIGEYDTDIYNVDGLYLENRVRQEHLTSEDVKQNRRIIENFRLGSLARDEEWRLVKVMPAEFKGAPLRDRLADMARHKLTSLHRLHTMIKRKSLPKPPEATATWDDYISATPGQYPRLGRPIILKEWVRLYNASVAMTNDFPLSIDNLLDVLEIIAPFKHLNKLRLFCQIKLPPGFPIQVEIPLLATVSARITFQKIQFRRDITDAMFTVPKSYCEESGHFPTL